MKTILVVAIGLVCLSAFAAQAYFTGKQELVTTVTYQQAWRCEYNYLGQIFYRVYQGSCPSSVEVQ